jgi:predicted nucleic acid-binding protein
MAGSRRPEDLPAARGIDIHPLQEEHRVRCRDLMKRYHDLPMDLADATLVALADTLNVSKVFTLNHKDFSVYRVQQKNRFTLSPSGLVS